MNRLRTLALISALLGLAGAARAADGYGKLTGIVLDASGKAQMGATVLLSSEAAGNHPAVQFLTDQNGVFTGPRLHPGLYSVKATLAGFLPTIQQHVSVAANATTLIRIELDSVFTSLDTLRKPAAQPAERDDWRWVLRTSSSTRPVLQLRNGTVLVAGGSSSSRDESERRPRAQLEMTSGSWEPGSSSARAGSLATTASYEQSLGGAGKLFLAGRLQYPGMFDDSLGGSIATVWSPSGNADQGPETTIVLRQIRLRPDQTTSTVRTMRAEHTERIEFADRASLEYGAEYVMGGIADATMASAVRPHARLTMRLSSSWTALASLETNPDAEGEWAHGEGLESAIGALNTLPVLVWANGRANFEGGWHEEFAVRRKLSGRASIEAAAFHDYSSHQAVFGIDSSAPSPAGIFSTPWAHDAGAGGSWGTRVVYQEKVSDHLEVAGIYAWAGALTPTSTVETGSNLADILSTTYRNSAAVRVTGKLPRAKTQINASYKWLQGDVVSRQDLFGEAALGVDPNLSLTVRQPLPSFFAGGHWEALADFRNVLAQGYVPINSQDGRLMLMPVERSFRGGVSVQF